MKYLVLLIDGAADLPVKELSGKTPFQAACKPNIDRLAAQGEVGLIKTVPDSLPPGSDVANLAVMGYDPQIYYTGRSPLEAASIGVDLAPDDVALRCNLVTLSDHPVYAEKIMIDYSSDEITTPESKELIQSIQAELNSELLTFYSGISYRHLLVWHHGSTDSVLTPPHDISDQPIGNYLPKGAGAETFLELMQRSQTILADHPVNRRRISKGLRPANSIWLWGQGKKPRINNFTQKYGLKGTVISAVDLIKGLGICAGLDVVNVPGATGNINTNFKGKAEATIQAFKDGADFVYLHFEAADEAGHRGEIGNKVLAIEKIDHDVLGYILTELEKLDPAYRILVLPDHPTPLMIKTHTGEPVPYLIYDSTHPVASGLPGYDEELAARTGIYRKEGYRLMDHFIGGGNDK